MKQEKHEAPVDGDAALNKRSSSIINSRDTVQSARDWIAIGEHRPILAAVDPPSRSAYGGFHDDSRRKNIRLVMLVSREHYDLL